MTARKLIHAKDILGCLELQHTMAATAATEDELGALQERAVGVVRMATSLEIENDKQLTDEALATIAASVVGTMDIKKAALAGYQMLVSYFGPTGVPDQLPTTWAKSWAGWQEEALIPEISDERGAELAQVQNTAAVAIQAVMDAEEVLRDLGRLETAAFYATVSDVLLAQTYQKIKETKSYKNLPYIDSDGKARHVASLDEFCQIKLGKSSRRLQELSSNLATLGPDLYESAERIGFRAKDYRALKALPAEEQEVVKTAIESESKDEVLDILQDMAARHQAEREASKKREEDLTADYDARGKLLADKGEQLERTKEELYRLKSLPKDADLELKLEREEEAVEHLHREHVTFLASSKTFLQAVSEILGDGDVSAHTKEHAVFEVRQVAEAFNQFLLDCSIPVDFAEIVYPDWMRDSAQDDLEAGNTEEPNGAHGSW